MCLLRRGNPLSEDQVACRKYGVVSGGFHCRRFRYDPLRRIPPKPAVMRTDFLPEQFCSAAAGRAEEQLK